MTDEILLARLRRSLAPRPGIFACPRCGRKRVDARHLNDCWRKES